MVYYGVLIFRISTIYKYLLLSAWCLSGQVSGTDVFLIQ